MTSERLLIFGGTFDPPQRAHLAVAREVASRLGCTRVLFVPAARNPLKERSRASAEHRLAMLRLVVPQIPGAEICLLELERDGPSYTVDTLRALRERFGPEAEMHLLMGSDAALSFPRWRDPEGILALATPAVVLRPPETRESFAQALRALHGREGAEGWLRFLVDAPLLDLSATDVRRRLANGEPAGDLLPPEVERYAVTHALYRGSEPPSR